MKFIVLKWAIAAAAFGAACAAFYLLRERDLTSVSYETTALAVETDRPRLLASVTGTGVFITADLPKSNRQSWSIVHGASGKGEAVFVLASFDGVAMKIWQYPLQVDGGAPNPTPEPSPAPSPVPPTPDPAPRPQKIAVTIIEESHDRTPAQAGIIASQTLRDFAKRGGHAFNSIDKDVRNSDGASPVRFKQWIDYANSKNVRLPYLFITTLDGGKLLWDGPLPENENAILAKMKYYGGESANSSFEQASSEKRICPTGNCPYAR